MMVIDRHGGRQPTRADPAAWIGYRRMLRVQRSPTLHKYKCPTTKADTDAVLIGSVTGDVTLDMIAECEHGARV
jgi:hypothetical protein